MAVKRGGADKLEKPSALAVLDALDVDELDGLVEEKRRELEALEVLAKAARVRRFGTTKRGRKPKAAESVEEETAAEEPEPAKFDQQLKVRIVGLLRTHTAARSGVIAEQLDVTKDEVEAVVRNDAAFEQRGPGYWYLS